MDVDMSAVFVNNPVGDGHAQSGALAVAAAREEGFEEMGLDLVGHTAAIVLDDQDRFATVSRHGDGHL